MANTKDIGNMFKEARERMNLTIEEVNQKSRIHFRILQDIENGAFEKLAPLYMRSFVKKYAEFLGLDAKSVVEDFDSLSGQGKKKPFSLVSDEKLALKPVKKDKPAPVKAKREAPKKEPVKKEPPRKDVPKREIVKDVPNKRENIEIKISGEKMHIIAVAVLALVLIGLVVVLVGKIKGVKPAPAGRATQTASLQRKQAVQRSVAQEGSVRSEKTSGETVTLTLKAKGKVWIQAKSGDKNLFAGVMEKGDTKTIKSDYMIIVQTGKAENVEFIHNGRDLGVIAAGVVKNIKVSSDGVKIGDKPVTSGE
jgi:transcriptional regulator with XRE-family HTH domain